MAIEMVRDGSVWAPRKVLSRLLDAPRGSARSATTPPNLIPHAKNRSSTCLREGRPNREIALALGHRGGHYAKAHISRLMHKVGVSNRIALTVHPSTRFE